MFERATEPRGVLEFIIGNVVGRDTKLSEHPGAGLDHQRRAAQVVFNTGSIRVIGQILFLDHFVNESGRARPEVLWLRLGQREIESEVGELPGQSLEIVLVKNLLP